MIVEDKTFNKSLILLWELMLHPFLQKFTCCWRKCKRNPKLIWPKNLSGQFLLNVPKRMRLGVSTDFREDMFWIDKFNELCDTITIDI